MKRHGERTRLAYRDRTNHIIGLAIKVHRTFGPARLGSIHAACPNDGLGRFVV